MKNIFFSLLIVFIILPNTSESQNNNTQAALYNVGIGGFFGGIGAIINKKKQEKPMKVFLKGFWQGFVGGYLVWFKLKWSKQFQKIPGVRE